MKAPWDEVKLRVVGESDVPDPGTVLELPTGRRDQVLSVRGRGLRAIVLPPGHDIGDAPVWWWKWEKRTRKARHTGAASYQFRSAA